MATRAELEAEIKQLKLQLASPQDAEVEKLRSDIESVLLESETKQKTIDSLTQLTESLRQDLRVARDSLKTTTAKTDCSNTNHVALDGKKYDIIWRSTVKDLSYEGMHKRQISEDLTAVVVQKVGG